MQLTRKKEGEGKSDPSCGRGLRSTLAGLTAGTDLGESTLMSLDIRPGRGGVKSLNRSGVSNY